jgi:hypothetical protein
VFKDINAREAKIMTMRRMEKNNQLGYQIQLQHLMFKGKKLVQDKNNYKKAKDYNKPIRRKPNIQQAF